MTKTVYHLNSRPTKALLLGFRDGLAAVVFPASATTVAVQLGTLKQDQERLAVEKVWLHRMGSQHKHEAGIQFARTARDLATAEALDSE